MKLKFNTVLAGALLSCTTACHKQTYQETAKPFLTKKSIYVLDTFANNSKKILNDTTYKCFGVDTIQIPRHVHSMIKNFKNNLLIKANRKMPKTNIDTVKSNIISPSLHQTMQGKIIRKRDNFTDTHVVFDNSKFYTKNDFDVFVPVKYYGKPVDKL